ncbi:MAG: flagellar basal body P-ring protein FlgI [Firmicutes bacterium]|nr:flagellar basal body P-ring protein FlgI [Bacillota bacterium]
MELKGEDTGDLVAIPTIPPVSEQPLVQPSVRLKDIARFDGIRENQLTGLGLVVGLDGTGDGKGAGVRMVANMLTRFGVTVDPQDLRSRNIAAVMVTANLPAFARSGDRLDVTVSSIGDAKSLQGGFLLQTPLQGADNQVYAVAQGPLSIGGFNVRSGRDQAQKNHPTIARGPGIAIVEREIPGDVLPTEDGRLTLVLHTADFTTASRTVREINRHFGPDTAEAQDSSSILLNIPAAYRQDMIGFLAQVEEIQVTPDIAGRVVINERTGTIVIGQAVRIASVAVAHGNLSVTISAQHEVVQPPAFSAGETVIKETQTLTVEEEQGQLMLLPGAATIGDLVNVLNAIGATPRDIVAILQAIKESGALYGELEII